jgi:hypothetical protein
LISSAIAVPIIDPTQVISIIRGDGLVVAKGSASAVMPRLNDGHKQEATLLAVDRAITDHRERELTARADSLDQREQAIEERERQAFADKVRSFADAVSKLQARMDSLEKRRADEDAALKALQSDDGDLEAVKPAPHPVTGGRRNCHGGRWTLASAVDVADAKMQPKSATAFTPTAFS